MAQYARLKQLLQHELGMSPTQKSVQLAEAIANDTLDTPEPQPVPLRGYELLEQVGEGAFGVVHRAYQPHLGR